MIKTAVTVALASNAISSEWSQTVYQRVGNTTYLYDGQGNSSSCQRIGNSVYCN